MPRRAGIAALLLALAAGLLPTGLPVRDRGLRRRTHLRGAARRRTGWSPARAADPAAAGTDGAWPGTPTCKHVDGQVIVKFKPRAGASSHAKAYKAVKGKPVKRFHTVPGLEVVETPLSPEHAGRALKADPAVEYVEPDCVVELEATPNDPGLGELWGLVNTGQDGGTAGADIGQPRHGTSGPTRARS
jgi:hypothetical protein